MNLDTSFTRRNGELGYRAVNIPYTYGIHYEAKASRSVTPRAVIEATCDHFRMRKASLLGKAKADHYAHPRQLAMLICREAIPQASAPAIGRAFNRDHTTILHGIKRARERIEWDDDMMHAYMAIRAAVGAPVEGSEKVRLCMFCKKEFLSSGPGERLCSDELCKDRRQTLSYGMGL